MMKMKSVGKGKKLLSIALATVLFVAVAAPTMAMADETNESSAQGAAAVLLAENENPVFAETMEGTADESSAATGDVIDGSETGDGEAVPAESSDGVDGAVALDISEAARIAPQEVISGSEEAEFVPQVGDPAIDVTFSGDTQTHNPAVVSIDILAPQTVTIKLTELADFTGKKLTIKVPEGLVLVAYPGMNATPMPTGLQAYARVDTEPSVATDGTSARFGTLVYDIYNDSTASITFEVQVGVDKARYYGDHIVPEEIEISYSDTDAGSVDPALISTEVSAEYSNTAAFYYRRVGSTALFYTANGATNQLYADGIGSPDIWKQIEGAGHVHYVQSAVYTVSYPPEAHIEGVSWLSGKAPNGTPTSGTPYAGPGGNGSVVVDSAAHEVRYYYANRAMVSDYPSYTLVFDSGIPGANYDIQIKGVFENYDGSTTQVDYSGAQRRYSIASGTSNRLTMSNPSINKMGNISADDVPGLTSIAHLAFVNNYSGGAATNQIIRYDFPQGLNVQGFDMPAAAAVPSITYKVYGDPTPRTVSGVGSYLAQLPAHRFSPNALGVGVNEQIEWAEANAGDFPIGFTQTYGNSASGVYLFGNCNPGEVVGTNYYTTVSIRSADDVLPASTWNARTQVDNPQGAIYTSGISLVANAGTYSYLPGQEIAVTANFNTFSLGQANVARYKDPVYYVLLPKGVSLTAMQPTLKQGAADVPYSMETVALNDGSGRHVVRFKSQGILGYSDRNLAGFGTVQLKFKMVASADAQNFSGDLNELAFVGPNNNDPMTVVAVGLTSAGSTVDTLDLNDNGRTDDLLGRRAGVGTTWSIIADPKLDVYAMIGPSGGPYYTYDATNPTTQKATSVPFTPGMTAEYVLSVKNAMDVEAGTFVTYVPVPKRGKNYGANFSVGAFPWTLDLAGAPSFDAGNTGSYSVTYTGDDVTAGGHEVASYGPTPADYGDVTMIRIEHTGPVAPGTDDKIIFEYEVGEDASFASNNPGITDIFNPYYFIASTKATGWSKGKPVAALLSTGQISGKVFLDSDRNGYISGTESGMSGVEVRLRLPAAGAGSDYGTNPPIAGVTIGSDVDGSYVCVATDANGEYSFPALPVNSYDVEFVNPNAAHYAFTLKDTGGNDQIDSDANTSTGRVVSVDASNLTVSKYISAGFVYLRHSVTYDKNHASATSPSPTSDYASAPSFKVTSLPTPPTRTNYAFAGWYLESSSPTTAFTTNTAVSSATTVYAKWVPVPVSIAYVYEGSTEYTNQNAGASTAVKVTSGTYFGSLTAAPAPAPSKAGYSFGGWFTNPSSSSEWTFGGSGTELTAANGVSVNAATETGALTLKAKWTARTVNVSFDSNGGTAVSPASGGYDTMLAVAPSAPTKTGYDFAGWYADSGFAGSAWSFGPSGTTMTVANGVTDGTGASAASLTLHAKWTARTDTAYQVRHYKVSSAGAVAEVTSDRTDLTGTTGTLSPSVALKNYAGYAYAPGYSNGGDSEVASGIIAGDGSLVLKLYYSMSVYTVRFVGFDGSVLKTQTVDWGTAAIAPAAPGRAHYSFTGWSADFGNVRSDLTVTARYAADSYTVTFADYDGSVLKSERVEYRKAAVPPTQPRRAGYTFAGWDKNESTWTSVSGDVIVTATYSRIIPAPENETRVTTPPGAPVSGIATAEVEKLEAQSGNIVEDITEGNIPLGGITAKGVWSVTGVVFAVLAMLLALINIAVAVRRRSDENLTAKVLSVLAAISGMVAVAVWWLLEDLSQPMSWVNGVSPVVAVILTATTVFTVMHVRALRRS